MRSTRVLPLPAPATTSRFPKGAVTASRCRSFRDPMMRDTSNRYSTVSCTFGTSMTVRPSPSPNRPLIPATGLVPSRDGANTVPIQRLQLRGTQYQPFRTFLPEIHFNPCTLAVALALQHDALSELAVAHALPDPQCPAESSSFDPVPTLRIGLDTAPPTRTSSRVSVGISSRNREGPLTKSEPNQRAPVHR